MSKRPTIMYKTLKQYCKGQVHRLYIYKVYQSIPFKVGAVLSNNRFSYLRFSVLFNRAEKSIGIMSVSESYKIRASSFFRTIHSFFQNSDRINLKSVSRFCVIAIVC